MAIADSNFADCKRVASASVASKLNFVYPVIMYMNCGKVGFESTLYQVYTFLSLIYLSLHFSQSKLPQSTLFWVYRIWVYTFLSLTFLSLHLFESTYLSLQEITLKRNFFWSTLFQSTFI